MPAIFQQSKIKGHTLATAKVSSVQSASVGIFLPVGSRHEDHAPDGISHFLEHMIFKGTSLRSASQLAIEAESAGISMNAYTTEDHTLLEMKGVSSSLPLMIELIADMLWNSTFSKNDIGNEAQVIEEEIIGYEESPADHVHDILSKALWPNHRLGFPITGTTKSIQAINSQQLQLFQKEHYLKQGICTAVAGNVEHHKVEALIDKHFPTISKLDQSIISTPTSQPKDLTEYRDIEQAHCAIGYLTPGRHSEQRHALRIISILLGENMSSLLFQKIREDLGLCYSIHTDFSLFQDIGSFNIYAALDGERFEPAKETIELIIKSFTANGPSEQILKNAKRYAVVQNQLALEGSQPFMQWIGDSVACYDRIILPEEAEANINKVTKEEIVELSRQIFKPETSALASIVAEH